MYNSCQISTMAYETWACKYRPCLPGLTLSKERNLNNPKPWADPEGGWLGVRTPLKNHKDIGCLSNTYLDPPEKSHSFKPAFNVEALPGVLGNRGNRAFISGEQENKGQILRGAGEQRQYWGTGNIRKQIFDLWGTEEQANLFQGNKGTGTPLGGPQC